MYKNTECIVNQHHSLWQHSGSRSVAQRCSSTTNRLFT